jgi:hypothetical protein
VTTLDGKKNYEFNYQTITYQCSKNDYLNCLGSFTKKTTDALSSSMTPTEVSTVGA